VKRELTIEDGRAAAYGGLVYGAGGGGLASGLKAAETALALGRPVLATLDEFDDDDVSFVSTGVGAPGRHQNVYPRDKLRCHELLRNEIRSSIRFGGSGTELVGFIPGHPSAGMAATWLHSAVEPGLFVLDCATNGRGHPSVRMGGMGLASDPSSEIIQAAVGGVAGGMRRLELVVSGPLSETSDVVRGASAALGGSIAACRGPFRIGFLHRSGAVGAVSASIDLGHAMLRAEGNGADAMIDAIVTQLGGDVVASGVVSENTVELRGAYNVGRILVEGRSASADVSICNEFMALDIDGVRASTFPDLIVTLSLADGMPTAAAQTKPGDDVAVVVVDRSKISLGAGVYDPLAYPGVEALLGKELATYAITATRRDSVFEERTTQTPTKGGS
jgi:uncharacterized protein